MNEKKKDNIYIYLWENLNTVYVGRTVNPKGRHYQHKHRETERTYQFSAEHGVEHPKMIIIENGLTIDEGVEHEKYWIKKYRDDMRYNVLNKTRGGQIGGQLNQFNLSEEDKKKKRRAYNKEHRKEINEYYREYHRRINAEKKALKAQKKVEKKILKAENKIRKLVYEFKKKKYYEEHKEERKKYQKEYYENNKTEKKHYDEIYYKKNKEKINANKKEHRKLTNYDKIYYKNHRDEILKKRKLYRELHKNNLVF